MGLNKDLHLFVEVSPFILFSHIQPTLKDSSVKKLNKLSRENCGL